MLPCHRGTPQRAFPTVFLGRWDACPTLRAPHAVPAVVAEVAVAVADGDGAAVVATGGVELEASELVAHCRWAVAVGAELCAGSLQQLGIDFFGSRGRVAVAIRVAAA